MKLGIMQPYFFPYLGYWALIKQSDKWIVFDTPQYIRHGWINRNRVLKPIEGWQYITVPLKKHERETLIIDIHIDNSADWKDKIIRQLFHYKKIAKYYQDTITLIESCLAIDTDSISVLNTHILKTICEYLDISFEHDFFSKLNIPINAVSEPDEWALEISKALGATEYLNPPGGLLFFNKDKFSNQAIKLSFLKINSANYIQYKREFIPDLSIIDILMFNEREKINSFLDNYLIE